MLMVVPYEWSVLVLLTDLVPLLQCVLLSVFDICLSKHTSATNNVLRLQWGKRE